MRATLALWAALLAAPAAPPLQAPGAARQPAALPQFAGDSTGTDSSTARPAPADTLAAPADSLAAFEAALRSIDDAAAKLSDADRRVLGELAAAARELYETGDVEAARLALADAREFVRQRSR